MVSRRLVTPVLALPRFRRAEREMQTLASREEWPRPRLESYQLDRLNRLWAHARMHVAHYRDLSERHGLPPTFSSLGEFRQRVPVLPRDVVKQQTHAFLSDAPQPGAWRLTGGSTGVPTRIYWGREAHQEMLRAKYRFYAAWGVRIFDRMAYLWGRGRPGLRQRVEDRLRRRLRLSAYFLDERTLDRYLERIETFRPMSVYSYATAAYVLAQAAARRGFSCDSLRLFTLSSEPAYPHMVRAIERAFGVPAAIEYGSVDCGFTAAESPDRTLRVREDVSLVETHPRDDGRFDLVVTVLNNPSFPLIRYAIGDVSDEPLAVPSTGFARLANVAGRANDLAVTRDGRLVHFSWFDAFFQQTPALRRWQIEQSLDGRVAVRLELESPDAVVDLRDLEARLSERLGGYAVTMSVAGSLPQTLAGKHRWVRSALYDHRTSDRAPAA